MNESGSPSSIRTSEEEKSSDRRIEEAVQPMQGLNEKPRRRGRRVPPNRPPWRWPMHHVGSSSVFFVRVALELLAVCLVILTVAIASLAWWLHRNPTEITLFGPQIERALAAAFGSERASFHSLSVSWNPDAYGRLQIMASGVELRADDGRLLGRLQSLAGALPLRDLLIGHIRISTLHLDGLTLPLRISGATPPPEDTAIDPSDAPADPGQTAPNTSVGPARADDAAFDFSTSFDLFPDLFAGQLRASAPDRIELTNLRLLPIDANGAHLMAPLLGELTVRRGSDRIALDGLVQEPQGDGYGIGALQFFAEYRPASVSPRAPRVRTQPRLSVQFSGLNPQRWQTPVTALWSAARGELAPWLETMSRLALPVAGLGHFSLADDGTLHDMNFTLSGSPGELRLPELYDAPLPVFSFTLRGTLEESPDGPSAARVPQARSHRLVLDLESLLLGSPEDAEGFPEFAGQTELIFAKEIGQAPSSSADKQPVFSLKTELNAQNLPLDWLKRGWPQKALPTARSWVTRHMHQADMREGRLQLELIRSADGQRPQVRFLNAEALFSDVTLNYFKELPDATAPNVTMRLTPRALTFQAEKGRNLQLSGRDILVRIEPSREASWARPRLSVETGFSGTVRAALDYLEHEPISAGRYFPIPDDGLAGTLDGTMRLSLPLHKDIELEDLSLSVNARLSRYQWPNLVADLPFSGQAADVDYTDGILKIHGAGQLGAPLDQAAADPTGNAAESDADAPPPPNFIRFDLWRDVEKGRERISARTDALQSKHFAAFGVPYNRNLFGTVSGSVQRTRSDGSETISADLVLDDLAMVVPEIAWRKERGASARLQFEERAREDGTRVLTLSDFSGKNALDDASSFSIRNGTIHFSPRRDLRRATLEHVHLGQTRMRDFSLTTREDGALVMTSGWVGELRVGRKLDPSESLFGENGENRRSSHPSEPHAEEPKRPVQLDLPRIGRLRFGDESWLQDAALEWHRDAEGAWRRLAITGEIPFSSMTEDERKLVREAREKAAAKTSAEGAAARASEANAGESEADDPLRDVAPGRFSLEYGPARADDASNQLPGQGQWATRLAIHPLGAGLKAVGLTQGVERGTLLGTGQADAPWPHAPMPLFLQGENFVLREVSFFTQLLSLISVTGAVATLLGQGVGFSHLSADLEFAPEQIDIRDFFIAGERIGITSSGRTDLDGKNARLQGAVVPTYVFNALLGRIPVIGTILSGGEAREGIFAVNYQMEGSLSEPEISANPISVVAPGLLRRLFGGGARRPEENSSAEDAGTQPATDEAPTAGK